MFSVALLRGWWWCRPRPRTITMFSVEEEEDKQNDGELVSSRG